MTNSRTVKIALIAILVIAIGAAIRFSFSRTNRSEFCFDFVHDTQFGDKKSLTKPTNIARVVSGHSYYLPQVPALQQALRKQGFYIDPYEATGGEVYAAAFFGPSTRAAVIAFQKKYGIAESGEVTNETIDKLDSLYSCPKNLATSTPSSYSVSTTTIGK